MNSHEQNQRIEVVTVEIPPRHRSVNMDYVKKMFAWGTTKIYDLIKEGKFPEGAVLSGTRNRSFRLDVLRKYHELFHLGYTAEDAKNEAEKLLRSGTPIGTPETEEPFQIVKMH